MCFRCFVFCELQQVNMILFVIFLFFNSISASTKAVRGYDCQREGLQSTFTSAREFCNGFNIIESSRVNVNILQNTTRTQVEGLFCKLVISSTPHGCGTYGHCLLYTSPSPRDMRRSRMPSSA